MALSSATLLRPLAPRTEAFFVFARPVSVTSVSRSCDAPEAAHASGRRKEFSGGLFVYLEFPDACRRAGRRAITIYSNPRGGSSIKSPLFSETIGVVDDRLVIKEDSR